MAASTNFGEQRRGMAPEDIGGIRNVGEPKVSPDGKAVAFTVTDVDLAANRYRQRVWLTGVEGRPAPRPFSAGPDDALPCWSPDGQSLAFAMNDPEGPAQVCVLAAFSGGERVVVATWPETISELAWSPDGTRLAFVARDRAPEQYGRPGEQRKGRDMPPRKVTRLYSRLDTNGFVADRPKRVMVVPADGSAQPLVLTPGPYQASGLTWSPSAERIAFASARHGTWDLDLLVDLWAVAADGSSEPERLTGTDAEYSCPAWSPDGSALAYLFDPTPLDPPRNQHLGVLDLSSGAQRVLSHGLDRNWYPYGYGRAPVWCGEALLCSVEDSGNVHIYAVRSSGTGKPEGVVTGERWVAGWDWAGGTLASVVTTPTVFPELFVRPLAPRNGALQGPDEAEGSPGYKLTDVTRSFAGRVTLAAPVPFAARSADGTEVPCWAIAPVGAEPGKRYPTLVNVHGGPFTSYGNRFFDEFQVEAGNGFGVLYCNPRGSSGYEEAWGRAVRWPECKTDPGSGWGGVDFDDVMACVDEACRRFDWADPERLGIMGGSYGGFMTSWAIGHTKRFKAACSERAANNLLTLEHNSDIAGSFRGYVGLDHLDGAAAYLRQSPSTYVKDMTTPVLLLHSEDDLRCPISQAEELFVALRLLGRDPVLVRFPGESHELSRSGAPGHRVERARIIVDWFKEKLGPGPA